MLAEPNCSLRKCKHLLGVLQPTGAEDGGEVPYCPAFPDGIPHEIAYGADLHLKQHPAQVGSTLFEQARMAIEIPTFATPESYEQYALNVQDRWPDRAQEARRQAVILRAAKHGATTDAERECLEAVYAYERILWETRGKKVRASRTWQMIQRHGVIPAVERVVARSADSAGYTALMKMGMQDLAFEHVVLRHPELFSAEAVQRSRDRLHQWSNAAGDLP